MAKLSDALHEARDHRSFTINLGKFDHDLTTTSLEIMVSTGNHPQMAELFRLMKYYNLPRSICGEFSMGIFHGNIYLGASWEYDGNTSWEYDGNILGQNAI